MDAEREVNELLGLPATLLIGGTEISIQAFQFRQLPAVTRLALPMISEIVKQTPAGTEPSDNPELDWLTVFERHTERVHGLMALSTGLPVSFVATLDIDDGLALLEKVIEVNAAFFTKALPRLMRLAVQMTLGLSASSGPSPSASPAPVAAASASGPASPMSSSPADTAGPTS